MKRVTWRWASHRANLAAGALLLVSPVYAMQAQDAEISMVFAIEAGTLQHALVAYAAATGVELLYSTDIVAGREAPRLVGAFTPQAALARLLAGTGLSARRVRARVFVLEGRSGRIPAPPVRRLGSAPDGLTSTDTSGLPATAPYPLAAESSDSKAIDGQREIVVTGTHIRGRNPGAPPVTAITQDDLTKNGYATVAQALQALPGNFGGMANEQSALSFADVSGTNSTLATGVDLRGLGAGATLVLVNGQRVGGSGAEGAFGDVSTIPTGAVDHVEVLLDGASAIYGSDAVGGVVNILLKRQFEGAETRVRLGSVTNGDKRDVQLDQTIGRQWGTGGAMLSYEFSRDGRLASADRAFARSADSRPFGGTDHRYIFSLPGNVLGVDPTTGAFGAAYAIPAGQNGVGLTPASFLPGVTNLQNRRLDSDLIPRQVRHSVYATFDQDIGSAFHLTADARYAHRAFDADLPGAAAVVPITAANPYFVSPTGASLDLIAYSLEPELGPIHTFGIAEAMAYSLGLDADLGSDWKLRSYAAFAQARESSTTDHLVNTASLAEAVGLVPDDPSTPFSTAINGFFNPYGTGTSNPAATIAFIGNAFSTVHTRSRILTGHFDADGTLFALPGGPVKLALGGDIRRENFVITGVSRQSTASVRQIFDAHDARVIEAGFAELHVPIFGADNAVPGLRRLDLSIAGRIEHYPQFGTTSNPKLGISWVPLDGITLRASYGTSFRAPNLRQLSDPQQYSVTTLNRSDGTTVPVLQLSGGNPGLTPEKARSWNAGIDLDPAIVSGLHLGASWFRTIFRQRIATPANENFDNALTDPTLAPFVQIVSPGSNAADLARITALLSDPAFVGGNSFPVTSIGAIVDTRYVNTGKVDVSGIDLSLRYTLPAGPNRFDLSANGSYLLRYREQVTPTSTSVDERNRVGEPVDLRGRMSIGWSRGVANAVFGMNYVAPYHDLNGKRIDAWTTFDLQIGVTAPDHSGWLSGTAIAIVANNLFDKSPPFYDSPLGLGYDATNADALQRFVAIQLTRRW